MQYATRTFGKTIKLNPIRSSQFLGQHLLAVEICAMSQNFPPYNVVNTKDTKTTLALSQVKIRAGYKLQIMILIEVRVTGLFLHSGMGMKRSPPLGMLFSRAFLPVHKYRIRQYPSSEEPLGPQGCESNHPDKLGPLHDQFFPSNANSLLNPKKQFHNLQVGLGIYGLQSGLLREDLDSTNRTYQIP
ncbi:hypothetical protein P691DRAFT_781836 [Macrolepiota fuliginosa MF-IS2]|uniref:Uncharacterized protein n=1 Tax=Macrolepiota fuliginosa MF-IS2 TaxID=1400762 RepID=A0A9P5WZK9_9AGAR|nr:hypothetical protein P691DRAFT_781836 [Macrolepiota fuliginosa MF-IS2]